MGWNLAVRAKWCFHVPQLAARVRLQVFNLVNLMFDRLADSVKPFLGTIMQLLPDLWRESEDQSLLRIQARLPVYPA